MASTSSDTEWEAAACPVCLEKYQPGDVSQTGDITRTPRILYCGHTMCSFCLRYSIDMFDNTAHTSSPPATERLTKDDLAYGIKCPSCRHMTRAKDRLMLESLPINFALLNIIDTLEIRKEKQVLTCDACQRKASLNEIRICLDCERTKGFDSILCTICFVDSHNGHQFARFDMLVPSEAVREKIIAELQSGCRGGKRRAYLTTLLLGTLYRMQEKSLRRFNVQLTRILANGQAPLSSYRELFQTLFVEMVDHNKDFAGVLGETDEGTSQVNNISTVLSSLFR